MFDAPVTILPSGNVLIEGSSGRLYEFNATIVSQNAFAGGTLTNLPTGEILVGGSEVYQASGKYKQLWAPTIATAPSSVTRGQTYQISGTQFNGVSQGGSLGDEDHSHSNYPLLRITNIASGHVFYARTHDHSTMGVATGTAPVSTNFDVPAGMETGASKLEVVANGILQGCQRHSELSFCKATFPSMEGGRLLNLQCRAMSEIGVFYGLGHNLP